MRLETVLQADPNAAIKSAHLKRSILRVPNELIVLGGGTLNRVMSCCNGTKVGGLWKRVGREFHTTAAMRPFSSPQRENSPNVTNCFHTITKKMPKVISNWQYKNKDAGLS
jgi:hypothetical protein